MMMTDMHIQENERLKKFTSDNYNYVFDKVTGFFARYGVNMDDDPAVAPAPEILDIEITTICNGVKQVSGVESPCRFCYKSNTKNGKNMPFSTFKKIIDKFPKFDGCHFLTQIAFGADSHATSNPDLWAMMEYSRSLGIIPNITVADISDETADQLVRYCGAVAVSRYANKDLCYDSVQKLIDRGMNQINIHMLVAQETEEMVWETMRDRLTDPRLQKLNAIVLLSLKQKGRGENYHQLPVEKFKQIVDFALDNKIGCGFDSCSCGKFLTSIQGRKNSQALGMMSESCESTLMSFFINVDARCFPCSFCEGSSGWEEGIDVLGYNDFRDIWNHEKVITFRNHLLKCNRNCPLYQI
jgi:hypothetical protein